VVDKSFCITAKKSQISVLAGSTKSTF